MKSTVTYSYAWPAFNLRMAPELKLALAVEAEKNHRSLNAEIIYRLTQSLNAYSR